MLDIKKIQDLHESIKHYRVLYVDSDTLDRNATEMMLTTLFSNVDVAEDEYEAWAMYNDAVYDIVITDIQLPQLDGITLISRIREIDTTIPILILSRHIAEDVFTQSIRLGVDGYLLKPIESEQFFALLVKVIKQTQTHKELLEYQENLESTLECKKKELVHKYLHEYYTDLPNSISLYRDLENDEYSYMLLLDMSHFAVINKEYGKEFANLVIARTADVLKLHINYNSKLYKTESDRFVILVKNISHNELIEYCKQIVSFFDMRYISINEVELPITFNIGVSKIADEIHNTIIHCEYALDKSKEIGSRHFEIYSDMHIDYKHEKESVKWLRKTRYLVLNDKIEPYFQPIKDISKDKIFKYEVLARGVLDGEIIYPEHFIPQAEQLGLISSITKNIITKSFQFFQYNKHIFSINITLRDLMEGYLLEYLKERTKYFGIHPNRVVIEVLEDITIAKNDSLLIEQLVDLKKFGCQIAIDDFGIENSNFSRLLNLDLDYIKLDGVFIKDLKTNQKNRTITRAIVNLSKTLGIKTVAEFVEDGEIYEIIKECGIDYAQGYHIGKAASELIE